MRTLNQRFLGFACTLMLILGAAVPAQAITFNITLDPGQEVPAPTVNGSTPSGTAVVVVNTITGFVSITGTYPGMTSDVNNSHLHGLAPVGTPIGVLFGLSNTGGTTLWQRDPISRPTDRFTLRAHVHQHPHRQ